MSWIIGILTFILVIDCLLMILLILVQLPKKEAGLGTAFGSGATDALFGAGTGNALTTLTKYAAGVFFALTLSLSILNAHQSKAEMERLESELEAISSEVDPATAPTATNAPSATAAPGANTLTINTNLLENTPAPSPEPVQETPPENPDNPN